MIPLLEGQKHQVQAAALPKIGEADRCMAGAQKSLSITTPTRIIKPQHAIDRLYELTRQPQMSMSPPKSASIRCGRRSASISRSPIAG